MKKLLLLLLFVASCVVKNEEDELEQSDALVEVHEPDVFDKLEQLDPYVELERLNNEVTVLLNIVNLPREKQAELKKIDIRTEYIRLVNEMYYWHEKIDWCASIIQDEEYLKGLDEDTNEINWGDFE